MLKKGGEGRGGEREEESRDRRCESKNAQVHYDKTYSREAGRTRAACHAVLLEDDGISLARARLVRVGLWGNIVSRVGESSKYRARKWSPWHARCRSLPSRAACRQREDICKYARRRRRDARSGTRRDFSRRTAVDRVAH